MKFETHVLEWDECNLIPKIQYLETGESENSKQQKHFHLSLYLIKSIINPILNGTDDKAQMRLFILR